MPNFEALAPFSDSILTGLIYTALLTIVPTILGTLVGMVLAPALAMPKTRAPFWIVTGFVELVRAVPPLVWLVWIYFALPLMLGITLDALTSALIVFTLLYAAFAADIFRGAIAAIPNSTIEAALAIGMTEKTVLYRVTLSEIMRRSFAALNAQTIGLLKMSSLASIIAVPELTYSFQIILIKKPLPYEVYTGMALAYIALIFPTVWMLRWIEQKPTFQLNPVSNA